MPKAVYTTLITSRLVYDKIHLFESVDTRGNILIGKNPDHDITEIDTKKFHIIRVRNITQEEYDLYYQPVYYA